MKRLEGKIALVTGAGRGIGAAIALKLAEEGATVIVNYSHSEVAAAKTAEEAIKRGGQAETFGCDVSDMSAVDAMIKGIIKKHGRLDILVNNAGITRDNLMMRMSEQEFDDVIRTNLKGAFCCIKSVSRYMLKQRSGRIINISSVVGLHGNAGQANYAASKAGIIGLTKAAAKELASRGITVNAIAPGFIQTDMTAALPEEVKEKMLSDIPLGFLGETEDIAGTALFLTLDDARYITGQVISVDGGMSI